MAFKVALVFVLISLAFGFPDERPLITYQAPQAQVFQPPVQQQTYQAPQAQVFQPPVQQQTYQQPQTQVYRTQQRQTYQEPNPIPPRYNFNWVVRDDYSANDYGHQESRDGHATSGYYYVHLPDGRRQRVDYRVDGDSGFVARVSYEGEATYPPPRASHPQPQPTYQPQSIYQRPF